MSLILRVILFVVFAGIQFSLPFAVLHWGFGLDDEWCLFLSWIWATAMILVVTSPTPEGPRDE
jgi:hypothetical protein